MKPIKFDGQIRQMNFDKYPSDEFAVVNLDYLGTNKNSHGLDISDEVLRRDAGSILGKWIVAIVENGDCGGHDEREKIVGKIPENQEVKFNKLEDGTLRANVIGLISKVYASDFMDVFENEQDKRSVSVEMKCVTMNDQPLNDIVESLNIVGVTVLGKEINPSSPGSDVEFIRFSDENAEQYFEEIQMSVAYKIDKDKDSMSDDDWGDVDKTKMRNKIMEASNTSTLVKSVYLLVEDGWEDAPSEHLKYPVMQLKGDTFVYNRKAISSAKAYASQHNETSVLNKIKDIEKKLGLDEDREEGVDMEETKLEENVETMEETVEENMECNKSMEETVEDNMECKTEENMEESTEDNVCELENSHKLPCGEESNSSNDENLESCDNQIKQEEDMEEPITLSIEEAMEKISALESQIEDKEHIIMEKENELKSLREFKEMVEEEKKASIVSQVLASIKDLVSDSDYKNFSDSGQTIKFADINGWKNSVMATVGERTVNLNRDGHIRMGFHVNEEKLAPKSVWDRI